ncbi:hypothetical protein, partial [Meiothermus hypogaeus]
MHLLLEKARLLEIAVISPNNERSSPPAAVGLFTLQALSSPGQYLAGQPHSFYTGFKKTVHKA